MRPVGLADPDDGEDHNDHAQGEDGDQGSLFASIDLYLPEEVDGQDDNCTRNQHGVRDRTGCWATRSWRPR